MLGSSDYTVGWICASALELVAANMILDEVHGQLPQDSRDINTYTYGRIGSHNVVIAALPAGHIGNGPAAYVVSHMSRSFSNLRFSLLVGIGSGVPGRSDIRLGDVVVGVPEGRYGGVVQYDLGKHGTNGSFEFRGTLAPPPYSLSTTLTKVWARHLQGDGELADHIEKAENNPGYTRYSAGSDVLFKATYAHQGGHMSCTACDPNEAEPRPSKPAPGPEVHFGTIASGNAVINDAVQRDRLSAQLGGVLCFEMVASGIHSTFSCLVIRGISDYADSHSNKSWQTYAALCAAAFAKEVLYEIPGNVFEETY